MSDSELKREGVSGEGCSPHFQMDLLSGRRSDENGGSPLIRVSARARRLSIRVYPDARVEVVVPPRARPREVELFIATHREWIDSKRAVALRNRPEPQPFPPATIDLRASSETWALHLAGGAGRLRLVEGSSIAGRRVLQAKGAVSSDKLRTALRAWLIRAAHSRLAPRVAALAAATGVSYTHLSIRR